MKIQKYLYGAGVFFLISLILLTFSLTLNELTKRNYLGLEHARSITISGEETTYEKPDEAEIVFSVVTQGENYKEATDANSRQMDSVNRYLKEEGLEDEDLRTENFSVSPRYEQIEDNRRTTGEIVGYEVENNLRATVRDLDKIDSLISGAVDAGANKVAGLQFSVSNEQELKKEARTEAIEKAKREAEKIAGDLGVGLGRILDFSESRQFYPQRISYDMMEEAPEAGRVPIEPGETEITSSVNITFEIH